MLMDQKPPIQDLILDWEHKTPGGGNHRNLDRVEGENTEGRKKSSVLLLESKLKFHTRGGN